MKETLFMAFLSRMSQKLQYMGFEDKNLGQVSFGGFPATCASLNTCASCATPHQSTRTECTEVQMLFTIIMMMTVLFLTMIVMMMIIFVVADDEHIQPLSQKCVKLAN